MTPRTDAIDIHPTYQAGINWDEIERFYLCTVKATEGAQTITSGSVTYFAHMQAKGFPIIGGYHWLRSDAKIATQVDNFTRWWDKVGGLDGKPGRVAQLDWETTPGIPAPTLGQVEEWQGRFWDRHGDRLITYCADWVPNFVAWRQRHPAAPLWYSNLFDGRGDDTAEPRKYNADVWQWGIRHDIPGCPRPCDVNEIWNYDTLNRVALLGAPVTPPVVDPPVIQPKPYPRPDLAHPQPILGGTGTVIALYEPTFAHDPTYTPATLAVFSSGAVRRACNADTRYADAHGVERIPLDSAEQYNSMLVDHGIGYAPAF